MSGTEWDDGEVEYPRAPLPPHERSWRHPSELGPSPLVAAAPMRSSRLPLVAVGVVGMALVAGLVQLLVPRSGTSVVATQSTQSLTIRSAPGATVSPNASVAATMRAETAARTTVTPSPSAQAVTTAAASTPTNAVSTVLLFGGQRAAVPVGDGRHAVTTAARLRPASRIDVELSDGTSVGATVVMVRAADNVAVLELNEPANGAPPALAQGDPQAGDIVYVGCSQPQAGVLAESESGLVVSLPEPPDEGSPVLDADGALVGLASTDDAGLVHLVSVAEAVVSAETTLDAPLTVGVWLGITFGGEDMVIAAVQDGAPAQISGLIEGDVLLAIDGVAISDADTLWQVLAGYAPGTEVSVLVGRGAEMLELAVTLAARPA